MKKQTYVPVLAIFLMLVLFVAASARPQTVKANNPPPPPPECEQQPGNQVIPVTANDTTAIPGGGFHPNHLPLIHVGRGSAGHLNDYRALMPVAFTPASASHAVLCVYVSGASGALRPVVPGQIVVPAGYVIRPLAPFMLTLGWNVIDVTPLVQDWISGAYPNYGIGLREAGPGPNFLYDIHSANNPVNPPRLVVVP